MIKTTSSENETHPFALQTAQWQKDSFYSSAVVLSLDVGIEGIGVCVRKGMQLIYHKSWMFTAWPKDLKKRRSSRAQRRCRSNLKTRLHRLKKLFEIHELPWFEERDPALMHSDPFKLRYRAITKGIRSKEALSLAIRHIVSNRGHYYNYYNDEMSSDLPWCEGDKNLFTQAKAYFEASYLTEEEADEWIATSETFEWKESEITDFQNLVKSRAQNTDPIRQLLEEYISQKHFGHSRKSPRGVSFSRSFVRKHLEEVINKNATLLKNPQAFLEALFIEPKDKQSKDASIFYYHRKTPAEMYAHTQKKTKRCSYAEWLGIPAVDEKGVPCALKSDPAVRRFTLLDFLATRRVELQGDPTSRVHLPGELIEKILTQFQEKIRAEEKIAWGEFKKMLDAGIKAHFGRKLVPKGKSKFNKDYLDAFCNIIAPTRASVLSGKAKMCAEVAEKLYQTAIKNGFDSQSVIANLKPFYTERRKATFDPDNRYPQVEFLLGTVALHSREKTIKHPNRKQRGDIASVGHLQKLFQKLAPELDEKTYPDYCVVEVIRDAPRTEKQKKEIEDEIRKNREKNSEADAAFNYGAANVHNRRLRVKLWEQQNQRSPFTYTPLGDDPFSSDLEICHLYPDSKGGLFIAENLVLAPAKENKAMDNLTPREAAGVFGVSWEDMLKFTKDMHWSNKKREIFAWTEADGIPEFENTTRIAQLGRQLFAAIGEWMQLDEISDTTERENKRMKHLGTPGGYLTACVRRSWNMPKKDRSDLIHHMVDAIVLSFIPPGKGLNHVRNGGIFYKKRLDSGKMINCALPLGPDPDAVAALQQYDSEEYPIVHFRSSSGKEARHDQTLQGVTREGELFLYEPLSSKQELTPKKIRASLIKQGISNELIPKEKVLEKWINSGRKAPLRLNNKQVIKRLRVSGKKDKKFTPAFGFYAKRTPSGTWQGIRVVSGRYEALEVWRHWDKKKKCWDFTLRRRPDPHAMEVLLRTGFSWFNLLEESELEEIDPVIKNHLQSKWKYLSKNTQHWRKSARGDCAFRLFRLLVNAGFPVTGSSTLPWEEVEKIVYGNPLPEGSEPVIDPKTKEPALVRKGDAFLIKVSPTGKPVKDGGVFEKHWFAVSAIKADNRIEMKALRGVDFAPIFFSKNSIAALFSATPHDPPPDTNK